MKRLITEKLRQWKDSPDRKPLLLTGIRQCGKTYSAKSFGAEFFPRCAYFNFEGNRALSSIFEYDFDVTRIVRELQNQPGAPGIVPGETLVIFDEIQECPAAVTCLKYFCEALPALHVIAAGSLLGVALKRQEISFPVGKVDRLRMYPMSFYEFLLADGGERLAAGAAEYPLDRALPELYAAPLEKCLKHYYIVGGMPAVVAKWADKRRFEPVTKLQADILADYAADFAKHTPPGDIPKLGWIWDSAPQQLARENNKFIFSHVKKGKRSHELEDALTWLIDAGLIHKLERVEAPELPLAFKADAMYFKVYLSDVGLLRQKANIAPATVLDETPLYDTFKGALTENFVLTELLTQGIKPYFWRSANTAELDFLFEYENQIIPVEAKAEHHTRAKSYRLFCQKYRPAKGLRLSLKNAAVNDVAATRTYSLPLYQLWRLREILAGDRPGDRS